jgi:predicted GNAT family acetyltransferase
MPNRSTEVKNNPAQHRYELSDGGTLLGIARYQPQGENVLVFTHTEIEANQEGQGYGSRLARGALDDVRRTGKRVVARCEFIAAYIESHPEYRDLLEEA